MFKEGEVQIMTENIGGQVALIGKILCFFIVNLKLNVQKGIFEGENQWRYVIGLKDKAKSSD